MLRTFLRSAIQATDSTLIGCSAKSAATIRLRQIIPVTPASIRKISTALVVCSSTLTRCGPAGFRPKQLAIEFVREPRNRMPVRVRGCRECPRDRVPGESRLDVGVLRDVEIVVEVEERGANDRVVKSKGCQNE